MRYVSSIHLLTLIHLLPFHIHISHSHFSFPNHVHDRHQWPMHCSRIFICVVYGINHLFFISVGFLFLMWVDNGARYQCFQSVWLFQVCNDHGRLECRSHYLLSDDCICFFQFSSMLIQRCGCYDNGCRSWHVQPSVTHLVSLTTVYLDNKTVDWVGGIRILHRSHLPSTSLIRVDRWIWRCRSVNGYRNGHL